MPSIVPSIVPSIEKDAAAAVHKGIGLKAVTDTHYGGSYWLASFATYLMTKRGQ